MTTSGAANTNRRQFLRGALASGLLVVPGTGLLAACAGSGGGSQEQAKGTQTDKNPLGVDVAAPLEVVLFAGGLKTEMEWVQKSYNAMYPNAKIGVTSTVNINSLQPRFTGGETPPDMVNDSGAQKIPLAALAGGGQLADLAPLLDAASIDDPSKKVRDTILADAIPVGTYDDKVLVLNYVLSTYGVWYSQSLFAKNGWKMPTQWSEFITFAEELKKAGLSPMGYGGQNATSYIYEMMLSMAAKAGGPDVVKAIDNLEPNAFKHDAVKNAAAAIEELARKAGFLQGSPGLTHTQAQTEFVNGKVGCYASGSWLDNEMKTVSPQGFDMVMAPTPRLSSSDKLPYEAVHANAGEPFIVPAKAKNSRGGLEFFRHMLSVDNARQYSELTGSLTIVKDSHAKVENKTKSLESVKGALAKASNNTFTFLAQDWYGDLKKGAATAAMADLLTGKTNADGYCKAAQEVADKIAADSNVKKFKRK